MPDLSAAAHPAAQARRRHPAAWEEDQGETDRAADRGHPRLGTKRYALCLILGGCCSCCCCCCLFSGGLR